MSRFTEKLRAGRVGVAPKENVGLLRACVSKWKLALRSGNNNISPRLSTHQRVQWDSFCNVDPGHHIENKYQNTPFSGFLTLYKQKISFFSSEQIECDCSAGILGKQRIDSMTEFDVLNIQPSFSHCRTYRNKNSTGSRLTPSFICQPSHRSVWIC